MSVLACLRQLHQYHDLLPGLDEHQAGHRAVLRGLPAGCQGCLDALAQLPLSPGQAQQFIHSQQLCWQAQQEADRLPVRWYLLRQYLHESLAAWQPF